MRGATWRLQLAVPEGAPPAEGWPCLWLLDGNATFPLAWRASDGARAAALVGIGHPGSARFDVPRRYGESTSALSEAPRDRSGAALPTGGREAFLDALGAEIMPAVARRVPLDPARSVLFGHSLAGLFVMYALLARPSLVRRYVAADPSLWWNNGGIVRDRALFRPAGAVGLLLETAGVRRPASAPRPPGWTPNAPDPRDVVDGLPGLSAWHRHVADATHGSILPIAITDALRFLDGALPHEAVPLPTR